MKRVVIILMVVLVAAMPWAGRVVLAGSPYPVEWIRQFGTSGDEHANSIAVDASGNVYVTGMTTGAFPGYGNSGGRDVFVRKYNSAGAEQWTRQFGTTANDHAIGIAVDISGNVFVAGWTGGVLPGQTNLGGYDAFIRKYNSAGIDQWTRQFGTDQEDNALGVATDSSGNSYVVGFTTGTFPGQSHLGLMDAFIRKYNSDGIDQWTRQFGGATSDDIAWAVATDSSGNVFVAGMIGGLFYQPSGLYDAFVRKYNSTGVEQWTRQFGTSSDDAAYGVAVDTLGNVFIAGCMGGMFPSSGFDAFVCKYNSVGVEQWMSQFGTDQNDGAQSVSVDTSGNSYVVGGTSGAFLGYTNSGDVDAFIRKYDSAGVEQWTYQFGTATYDVAWDVAADSAGNTLITGWTYGILPGQSSSGSCDAFVVKFTQPHPDIYPAQYRWSTLHVPSYKWDPYPSTFKSWQQVRLVNNGAVDALNVKATITWAPANVTIVDGQVSFGNIPAGGSAWSTDDFALVVDMNNKQPPNQIILWKIEYDVHYVMENVPQFPPK